MTQWGALPRSVPRRQRWTSRFRPGSPPGSSLALQGHNPANASSAPTLTEGSIVADKYLIEGVVGEGGMGVVFQAIHLELEHRVAIKVVRDELLTRDDVVVRMLREAKIAARLRSEHVTRVLDVGRLEGAMPGSVTAAVCPGENAPWPSVEACLTDCATVPDLGTYSVSAEANMYVGNHVQCRISHAGAAALADPEAHCAHAAGSAPCAD